MLVVCFTVCLSGLLCGLYLRIARRKGIFDIPNARSAHALATPRGGGVSLIVSLLIVGLLIESLQGYWSPPYITLLSAAIMLSVIGFVDDCSGLPVRLRFYLYAAICLLVAFALWPGGTGVVSAVFWLVMITVTLFWALNLFNFMDGIDGIAAVQAIMVCTMAALLAADSVDGDRYALFCLMLAGCHAGFLFWNFPPARLFLGDAGSIPTGFLLGGLAILGGVEGVVHPASWLVLMAVFITDATWTLLWRVVTGQPFTEAHRFHGYQRLARRWRSHRHVDLVLVAINGLWLFPIAYAVQCWPQNSLFIVILAYLPLLLGMAKLVKLP